MGCDPCWWKIRSISGEALKKGNDEKRLGLVIGASAEILVLFGNSNVKNSLRKSVDLELLQFIVFRLETMAALNRHELNTVRAQVQPASTIINQVTRTETFMRMRNKERRPASGLKCFLKINLSPGEIEILVQMSSRQVGKAFAVPRILLQNLLQACDRFVILLTINKIANAGERPVLILRLSNSRFRHPNSI